MFYFKTSNKSKLLLEVGLLFEGNDFSFKADLRGSIIASFPVIVFNPYAYVHYVLQGKNPLFVSPTTTTRNPAFGRSIGGTKKTTNL